MDRHKAPAEDDSARATIVPASTCCSRRSF
jgi:hypothetical protein